MSYQTVSEIIAERDKLKADLAAARALLRKYVQSRQEGCGSSASAVEAFIDAALAGEKK